MSPLQSQFKPLAPPLDRQPLTVAAAFQQDLARKRGFQAPAQLPQAVGGALGPPVLSSGAMYAVPGLGQALSAQDASTAMAEHKPGSAALAALGALPLGLGKAFGLAGMLYGPQGALRMELPRLFEAERNLARGSGPTYGWFQDTLGRLWNEAPDVKLAYNQEELAKVRAGKDTTLGALMQHPERTKRYPKLESIPIERQAGGGAGYWTGGYITLGRPTNRGSTSDIVHETGHAIQDIEDTATGRPYNGTSQLSPAEYIADPNEQMSRLDEQRFYLSPGLRQRLLAGAHSVAERARMEKAIKDFGPYTGWQAPEPWDMTHPIWNALYPTAAEERRLILAIREAPPEGLDAQTLMRLWKIPEGQRLTETLMQQGLGGGGGSGPSLARRRELPLWHGTSGGPAAAEQIQKEGFTKGRSAELELPGTSLSQDPLMSFMRFAESNPKALLKVKLPPGAEPVNLPPSAYLSGQVPETPFYKKPNVFYKEAETFARRQGGDVYAYPPAEPKAAVPKVSVEPPSQRDLDELQRATYAFTATKEAVSRGDLSGIVAGLRALRPYKGQRTQLLDRFILNSSEWTAWNLGVPSRLDDAGQQAFTEQLGNARALYMKVKDLQYSPFAQGTTMNQADAAAFSVWQREVDRATQEYAKARNGIEALLERVDATPRREGYVRKPRPDSDTGWIKQALEGPTPKLP